MLTYYWVLVPRRKISNTYTYIYLPVMYYITLYLYKSLYILPNNIVTESDILYNIFVILIYNRYVLNRLKHSEPLNWRHSQFILLIKIRKYSYKIFDHLSSWQKCYIFSFFPQFVVSFIWCQMSFPMTLNRYLFQLSVEISLLSFGD